MAIFGFLGPKDLCRAAAVCQLWHGLSNHNLLWRPLLRAHIPSWTMVTNATQPHDHLGFWSARETYLRCSPEVNKTALSLRQRSTSLFRLPFSRRLLRIAIFGQGLEGCAAGLVGGMLWGGSFPVQVTGMFPGIDGVGSGVGVLFEQKKEINMITLYKRPAAERRKRRDPQTSHLIHSPSGFTEAGRTLCRTLDAFLFVVDSAALCGASGELIAADLRTELAELLDMRWTDRAAPVLVLACRPTAQSDTLSAVATADALHLGALSRRWLVCSVSMDNFNEPLCHGLRWLCNEVR